MAEPEIEDADDAAAESSPRKKRRWGCFVYALAAVLLPVATLLIVYLVLVAIGESRAAEQRKRAVAAGDPLTTEAMQAKFYPESPEIDEATGHWNRAIEAMERIRSREPQVEQVPYWNAWQTLKPGADGFYDEATLARMDQLLASDGEAAIEAMYDARRAGAVALFASDIPTDRLVIGGSPAYETRFLAMGDLRQLQTLLTIDLERNAARGNVEAAVEDVLSSVAISEAYALAPEETAIAYQKTVYGVAYADARGLIARVDLTDEQLIRIEAVFSRQDYHARLIDLVQAEQYRAIRVFETEEPSFDRTFDALRNVPFRGADKAEVLERLQDFLDDAKSGFAGARSADEELRVRLAGYEDLSTVELLRRGVTILTTDRVSAHAMRTFDMRTQQALLQAGVACERYRLKHGAWPASLEDLVPEYIAEAPIDVFDGQPLRFRVDGNRLELSSIGHLEERYKKIEFDQSPMTFVIEKPRRQGASDAGDRR